MFDKIALPGVRTDSTDRAVSPVVGVVLMIVLAVSLTVVVGGFTSDLVDQAKVDSPPHATLNVYNDEGSTGIRVAHDGGDDLPFDELNVVVREANGARINVTVSEAPATLTPGDTFLLKNDTAFTEGTEYRVLIIDRESGNVIDDGVVEYES